MYEILTRSGWLRENATPPRERRFDFPIWMSRGTRQSNDQIRPLTSQILVFRTISKLLQGQSTSSRSSSRSGQGRWLGCESLKICTVQWVSHDTAYEYRT